MHGNCVLIPHRVALAVGNLDQRLTHGRGDFDYGFRARHAGFEVLAAPGFFATCRVRPVGAWRNVDLPLRARLESVRSPKYAIDEKLIVSRRHYGPLWFLGLPVPYAYIFLSHVWTWLASAVLRRTKP
jgi:hypothetical protein